MIAALTGTRWSITDAPAHVPARPGLYAIFGDERAHRELGLLEDAGVRSAPDLPLYVDKAEASFVERDLKDHFAAALGSTARTGGSTVRRSFAALLGNQLELHAVPRNLASPGYLSMYSLADDGDAQLTAWMHEHLSLAVWAAPVQLGVKLLNVETALIRSSRRSSSCASQRRGRSSRRPRGCSRDRGTGHLHLEAAKLDGRPASGSNGSDHSRAATRHVSYYVGPPRRGVQREVGRGE